ncbi:MAG: hypothetical protein ACI97A_002737 [Planctomycetota bacterium]|jgi:hypothetical protein
MSQKTIKLTAEQMGRRDVSFAAGTETIANNQVSHRRNRLRSAALILCACFAVVILNQFAYGDDLWRWQAILLVGVIGGLAALFSSDRPLTRKQLGLGEFLLVASVVTWLAGRHYNLMTTLGENADRTRLLTSANGGVIGFFTLIMIYGLVIPNHWKKTAWVVAALLIFPLAEPFLLKQFEPQVIAHAPEVADFELLGRNLAFLLIGSIVAVFGCHSLNSLRREVQEAKQIGQYRLVRKIGEGGMGEVWKAEHGLLARPAAIKLIKLEALAGAMEDSDTTIQRFEREAQVTANLRCPHTIEVFDYGTTSNGSCYYAMEFLDGLDLDSLIHNHGAIPYGRAVYLWQQVCRSLAEAHSKGMVHRDIKPANIYLCRLGLDVDFIKVLDFGLVTYQEGAELDAKLTQAGVVGTPAFITPEAMLGRDVDGRSDVYAMACVAYWLLTGKFIYSGTAMEMATGHARVDPPLPSEKTDNEIPKELEDLLMRCLAKDPDERPDALTLLSELEGLGLAGTWTSEASERWWRIHES